MHEDQLRAILNRRIDRADRKRDEAAAMAETAIEQAKRMPTGAAWSTIAAYATLAAQAAGEAEGLQFAVDLLGDEG